MKKRTIKKLKLKKGIKTGLVVLCIYSIITIYLLLASARIESIESNKEAYNENGHAYSIEVNFTK